MYKAIIAEYYGPFCGLGGYGGAEGTAMHRSPKRAIELAKTAQKLAERTADLGGQVPILGTLQLWKGTELVVNKTS